MSEYIWFFVFLERYVSPDFKLWLHTVVIRWNYLLASVWNKIAIFRRALQESKVLPFPGYSYSKATTRHDIQERCCTILYLKSFLNSQRSNFKLLCPFHLYSSRVMAVSFYPLKIKRQFKINVMLYITIVLILYRITKIKKNNNKS